MHRITGAEVISSAVVREVEVGDLGRHQRLQGRDLLQGVLGSDLRPLHRVHQLRMATALPGVQVWVGCLGSKVAASRVRVAFVPRELKLVALVRRRGLVEVNEVTLLNGGLPSERRVHDGWRRQRVQVGPLLAVHKDDAHGILHLGGVHQRRLEGLLLNLLRRGRYLGELVFVLAHALVDLDLRVEVRHGPEVGRRVQLPVSLLQGVYGLLWREVWLQRPLYLRGRLSQIGEERMLLPSHPWRHLDTRLLLRFFVNSSEAILGLLEILRAVDDSSTSF
mmetsp:Transcript_32837/g.50164  ORF Transcript_32837/g.50164 Transcript_32837/m.50164 type:complete len:278 (+) Transcript_32837:255-1088(+)